MQLARQPPTSCARHTRSSLQCSSSSPVGDRARVGRSAQIEGDAAEKARVGRRRNRSPSARRGAARRRQAGCRGWTGDNSAGTSRKWTEESPTSEDSISTSADTERAHTWPSGETAPVLRRGTGATRTRYKPSARSHFGRLPVLPSVLRINSRAECFGGGDQLQSLNLEAPLAHARWSTSMPAE